MTKFNAKQKLLFSAETIIVFGTDIYPKMPFKEVSPFPNSSPPNPFLKSKTGIFDTKCHPEPEVPRFTQDRLRVSY